MGIRVRENERRDWRGGPGPHHALEALGTLEGLKETEALLARPTLAMTRGSMWGGRKSWRVEEQGGRLTGVDGGL